jgi:hypothetical protein
MGYSGFGRVSFALLLLSLLLAPSWVFAVTTASDNAANPVYNSASDAPGGNGWANGDNGGSGFGLWSISTTANSGVFIGDSTGNGRAGSSTYYDVPMPFTAKADATGGVNATHSNVNDNRSFGLWANSGGASHATRPLLSPLQVNQFLRADIDNGFIENGGVDGLVLQDSLGVPRLQVSFTGGGANYSIIGATAQQTVHGYTGDGLRIQFQLTDIDHYRLAIWFQDDGSIEVFTGQLGGTQGNAISALQFFNHNAGPGSTNDFFFNNLAVLDDVGWQPNGFTGNINDVDISDLTYYSGALRIWIPDGVPVLRGVVLYLNYSWDTSSDPNGGDVRDFTTSSEWQAFCRNAGFALVATKQVQDYGDGHDSAAIEAGLTRLGSITGHSELSYVPIAATGISLGGISGYNYNVFHPTRTICFTENKGRVGLTDPLPASALNTPAMMIDAENNSSGTSIIMPFQDARAAGALFGYLDEPQIGHHTGYSPNFIMKYFANIIQQRVSTTLFSLAYTQPLTLLPETNGWIGDNSTWKNSVMTISDYASYSGNKRAASWMPDKDSAFLWRAVGSYNQPVRLNTKNNLRVYRLGDPVTVQCDTSALPAGWTKIDFYDGSVALGEMTNTGSSWFEFTFTPLTSEVGGVSALATLSTGDLNTSNAARFVVQGDPPAPPTYANWIASYGYSGASGSATADPDGDGIPNLLEYAIGTNPGSSASANHPSVSIDSNFVSLTYTKFLGATNMTFTVEESSGLVEWMTVSPTNVILSDNGVTQLIKAEVPRSDAVGGKLFLRLQVTQ